MKDSNGLEDKILSLVAEAAGNKARKAAITEDMRLQRDLGIDSIGLLALVVRFEEVFGIHLSDADLAGHVGRIRTVKDALNFGQDILKKTKGLGAER
jgi:acyl carrier protein